MRKATETLSRHWLVLQNIPQFPRWVTTSDMHNRLEAQGHETDIRTTQRDLERLSADFPIYGEKRGRTNYWQWAKGAQTIEIPSMTPSTALVFKLTEQYLRPLLPGATMELIEPYFDRAAQILRATRFSAWRKNVRLLQRGPRLISPKVRSTVRDTVYAALLEGRQFSARYRPRGQATDTEYVVNPLGLVVRDGVSYVISTLWDYDDVKHLAMHRISRATALEAPSKRPRDFDLDQYIEHEASFSYPVSKRKIRLQALFTEEAAHHLAESPLAEDQILEPTENDKMLLTATVQDSSELRWWLLGFGDKVEVRGPSKLRAEFAETARNLHQRYVAQE